MARNRARLSKAITLHMVGRSFMPWAPGAHAAFDFQQDRAFWTEPTNLYGYTQADTGGWVVAGTTPPTSADGVTFAGELCHATTFTSAMTSTGYNGCRDARTLSSPEYRVALTNGVTYTASMHIGLSRALTGSERITFYWTGQDAFPATVLTAANCGPYVSALGRISATKTIGAGTGANHPVVYLDNVVTSDITAYICKVQYEKGATATTYQANPNAAPTIGNSGRISPLSGVPGWTFTRASTGYALDLAGNLVSFASGALRRTDRGVLIEGARTNLCLQSQTVNTTWSKNNCTVSSDAITAPDGTLTADKVIEDTATGFHGISQLLTLVSGTTYTTSIYAKAGERSWMQMTEGNNVTASAYFNLAAGVIGTVSGTGSPSATITALGNGWYHCSLTYTPVANAGNIQARPTTGDGVGSYTGDGTSGIYVWGGQVEAAAFASSYIPTTTASVTRAADALSITGVSGITYPLTMFAEWVRSGTDAATFFSLLDVSAGSTNDRAQMSHRHTSYVLKANVRAGGVEQADITGAVMPLDTINKGALRVQTDDVRLCAGGTLSTADTLATLPAAASTINFGAAVGGTAHLFGYLRRAAIWNSAFTDAQLQTQSS